MRPAPIQKGQRFKIVARIPGKDTGLGLKRRFNVGDTVVCNFDHSGNSLFASLKRADPPKSKDPRAKDKNKNDDIDWECLEPI